MRRVTAAEAAIKEGEAMTTDEAVEALRKAKDATDAALEEVGKARERLVEADRAEAAARLAFARAMRAARKAKP
jgi:hypothetical protein